MAVDTAIPFSDGWWLKRLYEQLRVQQKRCEALQQRYKGNPPMPYVSDTQRDAVRAFMENAVTTFERVIVMAVLSRLRVNGIRTAVDADEGGDGDAFAVWQAARGKLFSLDVHEMALTMGLGYVIVGKDADGQLLVTAEDPRLVTAITDPADPYRVLAALKLFHDPVADQDVAYLYLPGRVRVAKRPRKATAASQDVRFSPGGYLWDDDVFDDAGVVAHAGASGIIPELATSDVSAETITGEVPVVPFFNGSSAYAAEAEFEAFLKQIDRLNQQMLQRMTIATIQAFKQRAFKGLPVKDDDGKVIDYNEIFVADPGAVWNIPATAEIWESGVVDLTPLVTAHREDVKDLYSTSGTPAYLASPDAANGSAESAGLQREQTTFKVDMKKDRFEISHQKVAKLMFLYLEDADRASGAVEILWAPVDRVSMTERANAIAQTRDVVPVYQQLTEIWGMDPAQADRAMQALDDQRAADDKRQASLTQTAGASSAVT